MSRVSPSVFDDSSLREANDRRLASNRVMNEVSEALRSKINRKLVNVDSMSESEKKRLAQDVKMLQSIQRPTHNNDIWSTKSIPSRRV
mgnify:FL=1